MSRQNIRSKANPGRDGKPRSTEPKRLGAKPRQAIGREQEPRPESVRSKVAGQSLEVERAAAEETTARAKLDASRFARAVDLTSLAEARRRTIQAPEGPLSPKDWHIVVALDYSGRCAVTGAEAPHWDHDDWECHHVIEKKLLRNKGLQAWVWDRRLGVYLAKHVHRWYDDASDRCIPREVLPSGIWELCSEIDEALRSDWATTYVLDRYPIVGPLRLDELRTFTPEEHE